MNKKLITAIAAIACPSMLMAQGWPTNHQGVMLQGFYWNSYDASNWKKLETQADELQQLGLDIQKAMERTYTRLAQTPATLPDSIPVPD